MSGCFIYDDNLDSQRMLHSLLVMGRYKAKAIQPGVAMRTWTPWHCRYNGWRASAACCQVAGVTLCGMTL